MMSVMRALLLSSQSKAKTGIQAQQPFVFLNMEFCHVDYWLVAGHYPAAEPGQQKDTFTLQMFTVAYEDGKPIIAEKPHKTCQFQGKDEFLAYLKVYDFHPEDRWIPVEQSS